MCLITHSAKSVARTSAYKNNAIGEVQHGSVFHSLHPQCHRLCHRNRCIALPGPRPGGRHANLEGHPEGRRAALRRGCGGSVCHARCRFWPIQRLLRRPVPRLRREGAEGQGGVRGYQLGQPRGRPAERQVGPGHGAEPDAGACAGRVLLGAGHRLPGVSAGEQGQPQVRRGREYHRRL
ncbi:hypothetical protein FQZ97_700510 [compost metagenome]